MSLASVRGGIPKVFRVAADATGALCPFPQATSYLKVRCLDAPCRVYFTETDFTQDINYILVPVQTSSTPHGEWEGPVETGMSTAWPGVWLRGDGGTSQVELVAFLRRG